MKLQVHQLVHGYSKGHSLLAASYKLPKAALEVVTEQSDLSGPLPAGVLIPSYLTAYPVPDSEFYALARTWPDKDAPRSGCVITHTLLISKETWGTTLAPEAYLRLHHRPDRKLLSHFEHEIQAPLSTGEPTQLMMLSSSDAYQFSAKVFAEGLQSVVWFDCEDSDLLVMSFASLLWPSLRNTLYAHTFSLHAQAKVKSNLQLHFAPRKAQSYFSRLPKQCRMTKTLASASEAEQSWLLELSEDLRAGHPRDSYRDGLNRFGHLLGGEPAAVRNLFVLRDLAGRMPENPLAAIGILDIIDSLEPSAQRAVEEKQMALDAALAAVLKADASSMLHSLLLIDARLRRPSFSIAADAAKVALKVAVKQLVAKEPYTFVEACRESTPLQESSFWEAAVDGIRLAAQDHPHTIATLDQTPSVASFVVRRAPSVARTYLNTNSKQRAEAIGEVIQWIRDVDIDEQRQGLRRELLPEIHDDVSVPLLEELLKDVRAGEVPYVFDTLVKSTQGFENASLRRAVTDFISQRFPEESIQWGAHSQLLQTKFVPELVAEAFTLSLEGIDQLLAVKWMSPDDRCEVLSAFVERAANQQLPQWFVRRIAADSMLLEPFAECVAWSARANRALEVIADQCEYIPLVRSKSFSEFVMHSANTNLHDRLIPKAVDSAITEHIRGTVDADRMLQALKQVPCEMWCEQVPASRIHNLLSSTADNDAWQRAWDTLSILPQTLFRRVANHQVIANFNRSSRARWSESVAKAWSRILVRAQDELAYEASLRLFIQSAAFCLNNPRLPVGQVLSTAFPPVYEAVSSGRAAHITDEMFGYFDWDKAKKLRKDLIAAYLASNWPPEELVLIAAKCNVLRKMVHRLQRKWNGDEYIRNIVEGLKKHHSDEAASVRTDLSAILDDPDFFEAWD